MTALKTVHIHYKFISFNWLLPLHRKFTMTPQDLLKSMKQCVPSLKEASHKGQAGRIGVIGGSLEYTGAPYFSGISALRAGADLVHIFCMITAATVIKSYSPELIVHPLLDDDNAVEKISPWLERLHTVVIGPGLGRDEKILQTVSTLIQICREKSIPLVIDADGLFLITKNISLIKDYPSPGVILTPNKVEFERLYKVIKKDGADDLSINIDFEKIGDHISILRKGSQDAFYCRDEKYRWVADLGGSGRRCGGQGDILSGSLGTFFYWATKKYDSKLSHATATFGASLLVRKCNEKAFSLKHRGMLAHDMIGQIADTFYYYLESDKN